MISIDKGLLGKNPMGDVIERHKKYGEFCDVLNIIVMCNQGYQAQKLSEKVFVWPTNSKNKLYYVNDAIKKAKQINNESGFDLIVCQDPFLTGWAGLSIKRKFGVKLLIHFHGDFWNNKNWLKEKWHNIFLLILSRKIAKKADGIRAVSRAIKNKLIKNKIDKNKIRVIPTPVNLGRFLTFNQGRVDELKEKYPHKNILFVGRLEKVKNLKWFLDVFRQIQQDKHFKVNFLVIGDGSLKLELVKKSENLGLKNSVRFIGQVEPDDLANYYHLADIVVLLSTSESFGKVLIEAAIAGKPCVASATTGAKEIIQDKKTGFIVPINDKEKMKERIVALLRDENLAQKMGENAKKYAQENFDGRVMIQKIVNFWKDLVKVQ